MFLFVLNWSSYNHICCQCFAKENIIFVSKKKKIFFYNLDRKSTYIIWKKNKKAECAVVLSLIIASLLSSVSTQ